MRALFVEECIHPEIGGGARHIKVECCHVGVEFGIGPGEVYDYDIEEVIAEMKRQFPCFACRMVEQLHYMLLERGQLSPDDN